MTDADDRHERRQIVKKVVAAHSADPMKIILLNLRREGLICSVDTVYRDLEKLGYVKRWSCESDA